MSRRLRHAHSIADLRRIARQHLPRAVFDFYDGGAEDESTLRKNREAFEALAIAPRVLAQVGNAQPASTLLGRPMSMPLAIAPMGAVGFGCRDGDVQIARAAAAAGVPYVLSTAATTSIERVAEQAAGARLWFQLYALRDRSATLRLIERIEHCGFEALVLTLDVPVGGKRERDMRNDFTMPFSFSVRNVLDFASRPRWALEMLLRGLPQLENLKGLAPADAPQGLVRSVGMEFDPDYGWQDLAELRERWRGKLLVKGILREDDALRAVDSIGCDGVIVSNHGGRQLDGAVATLEALPRIAAAVGGKATVLLDGGIRRGADMIKALALGADAVMTGRACLYGACAAGEAGAVHALEILRDELVRSMKLSGLRGVADIGPDLLWRG